MTFISAPADSIEQPSPVSAIAILPFSTLALKEDDEYLGLGLADALITQLSRARQLAVRPTSAVRRYLNEDTDALTAARQLNTDAILEGSVQHAGALQISPIRISKLSAHNDAPSLVRSKLTLTRRRSPAC